MKYYPHWGSFQPILIEIMRKTSGDVLELGMGSFSTPLLHSLCLDMERNLVSYENDKVYCDMHKNFRKPHHTIHFVKDWNDVNISDRAWSVAFVDHKPAERRKEEVRKLANNTQYVLIHDSQPEEDRFYKYSEIYPLFKYKFDYNKIIPQTTVLSNFEDLSWLRN